MDLTFRATIRLKFFLNLNLYGAIRGFTYIIMCNDSNATVNQLSIVFITDKKIRRSDSIASVNRQERKKEEC